MNLAALWKVPLLFICENNLYAMGTAIEFSHSVNNFTEKAKSYGMENASVDGMDVIAVEDAARKAVEFVRDRMKPFFLECRTYRFRAHSMFDAELYRDKKEVEEWKQRCPIATLTQKLQAQDLLSDQDLATMKTSIDREIDAAITFAEAGTWEPIEDLTRFVYSEPNSESNSEMTTSDQQARVL
ncbi:MAG: thiamine pyrophosphate-dependent enzyme, partial [Pseudanabaena sp.]